MKAVIAIILIVGAAFGGWTVYKQFQGAPSTGTSSSATPDILVKESDLPPLHEKLEASLATARQGGANGLRIWLATYQNHRDVKDPRLAWVQLDYVVLIGRTDIAEARRVFALVKKRVPENSVVFPRIKQLEPSYQ
jgi:hypothetical protein